MSLTSKDKLWILGHLVRLTKRARSLKPKPAKKAKPHKPKRVCKTRALKTRRLFAQHPQPAALFSGTIHFVDMTFRTSSGNVSVSSADLAVAIRHAQSSASAIAAYAAQYGPNAVVIDPTPIPSAVDVPTGRFSDADVQSWVASIGASMPPNDAIAILSPPRGVENTDAPVSQGVLGYHGYGGGHPYLFVNVLGTGLTLDDPVDAYALALSHEIGEMVVDPAADLSNPEVCDGCGPNCQFVFRDYFDTSGAYMQTSVLFPLPSYGFFINAIVQPAHARDCPAPASACVYGPPGSGPAPPPPQHPCAPFFTKALAELEAGRVLVALRDAILGLECLFLHL